MGARCGCCTCRVSMATAQIRDALVALDGAHDEWLERSFDDEGNLDWLLDAAEEAIAHPIRGRAALRDVVKSIRVSQRQPVTVALSGVAPLRMADNDGRATGDAAPTGRGES